MAIVLLESSLTEMSFSIAVLTKNNTNPAYIGARVGIDRMIEHFGCRAVHYVPRRPDDVGEQITLVSKALDRIPDAIIMCPTHPTRLAGAIQSIEASGTPLFFFVSETDISPAVSCVGSDDEALGHAMAWRLAVHLEGRGAVAIVGGHPDAATSAPRTKGFLRALETFPGIEVVTQCRGDYQRDTAYTAFSKALRSISDLDGVIVANDFMALGVLDALTQTGRQVPVVGANATPHGIELIKTGRMIASAAFDAMSMGALAVEAAVRTLRGEKVPARIELPVKLVDQTNLSDWDCDYSFRKTVPWETAISQPPAGSI